MQEDIAISVKGVSKIYEKGSKNQVARQSFTKDLLSGSFFRKKKAEHFYALDNITFNIKKGEAVGIIGMNGAGKSTLLEVLSGITKPDSGEVRVNGRLASILNIGTGFHPDLTGKENVYLNGRIMGMDKEEIDARLEDIVTFSELSDFIDEPVKYYSSGMYLRLAFSVFTHLDADVIMLDEVLNVGDAFFKRKCDSVIQQMLEQQRTVVIVSHSTQQLQNYANKLLLLEEGRLKAYDQIENVLESYFLNPKSEIQRTKESRFSNNRQTTITLNELNQRNDLFELIAKRIYGADGSQSFQIRRDQDIIVEWEIEKKSGVGHILYILLEISTIDGKWIIKDSHFYRRRNNLNINNPGRYIANCIIPKHLLYKGVYFVNTRIADNYREILLDTGSLYYMKLTQEEWELDTWFEDLNVPLQPHFTWKHNAKKKHILFDFLR